MEFAKLRNTMLKRKKRGIQALCLRKIENKQAKQIIKTWVICKCFGILWGAIMMLIRNCKPLPNDYHRNTLDWDSWKQFWSFTLLSWPRLKKIYLREGNIASVFFGPWAPWRAVVRVSLFCSAPSFQASDMFLLRTWKAM